MTFGVPACANLLCAICNHRWQLSRTFPTLEIAIEPENWKDSECPACGTRAALVVTANPETTLDEDESGEEWKRSK